MNKKIENRILWGGTVTSVVTIYMTKFCPLVAPNKFILDLGQQLWFNLAIAFLSSVIFYIIVVYIPERRKKERFVFQMGMEIQILGSKAEMLFKYLRDAAQMQEKVPDMGKLTREQLDEMVQKVTPQTIHLFELEHGAPRQTFENYLLTYSKYMDEQITKALVIPYEDLDLTSFLLHLQRSSIVEGSSLRRNPNRLSTFDIGIYFSQLRILERHYKCFYEPEIEKIVNASAKTKGIKST